MHPNQDHVLAWPHYLCDVKLLHQPTTFANSDLDAVQPNAVDRLHAVKAKQDPFRRPVRQLKPPAMISGGILVGDMWRIDRERIPDIGVGRPAVAAFPSL